MNSLDILRGFAGLSRIPPEHPPGEFWLCPLHGVPIVRELPGACPLREPNPFAALQMAKDRAWPALPAEGPDGELALIELRIADTCGKCVHDGMLSDPHVRFLRRQLAVDSDGGARSVQAVPAAEPTAQLARLEGDGGNGHGSGPQRGSRLRGRVLV